jgi:hypothetical protein
MYHFVPGLNVLQSFATKFWFTFLNTGNKEYEYRLIFVQ